ncbi:MAG: 7-cyano-7-deazaguanine synthase QueC [Elusimicrobia bacterium GWA2_62_23]|nr:MAG: 7-cyano-7-deazaguanine synthase QueC [Elusimicrobia bacterium GWA2_62_23]OGR67877.1 MAG: 7-cyano-7-deazaguanine synthase QueC [Elusimicrobia bacterium GWC2_63_65]
MKKKAVVLFSGGLDSTTALCWALKKGYECLAVSFDYGQRHDRENAAARAIARRLGVKLHEIKLAFPWFETCSLVNKKLKLPDVKLSKIGRKGDIPSTYVPGRNLVFASVGFSLADAEGADAIVLGPNVVDYSGYPDCRPEFYRALQKAAAFGTRRGANGRPIKILTPLIKLSKAGIARLGVKLGAPLALTWSCYSGGRKPCGHCDSCKLRAKGFADAGLEDPAL